MTGKLVQQRPTQPGGIWIVLDDVTAGIYSHQALWGMLFSSTEILPLG